MKVLNGTIIIDPWKKSSFLYVLRPLKLIQLDKVNAINEIEHYNDILSWIVQWQLKIQTVSSFGQVMKFPYTVYILTF